MAHVNGIHPRKGQYDAQFAEFKRKAAALGGTVQAYASFPHNSVAPESATPAFIEMMNDLYSGLHQVSISYKWTERPASENQVGGTMRVTTDGKVFAGSCEL